jgi:hypothetical protein
MKVAIYYRPNSEQGRMVEDFVHESGRIYPDSEIKLVDIDSKEGSSLADVYDIVKYPTVIAASDDGHELQRWDNDVLPLMSEVAYYANQ